MKKVIIIIAILISIHGYECSAAFLFQRNPAPGDTMKIELIFGVMKPDHKVIRKKEWKSFMEEVITSRFPDGFTVTDATGHWKEPNEIITEPSKIFSVVCIMNPDTETKIEEIIGIYKRMFQQEAVLRIDTKVSYWLK